MVEATPWSPNYLNADAEQHQQGQAHQHGIVVRNTFIDVRHSEEPADDKAPSSPHRRNLSAPPSPSRVGRHPRDPNSWGKGGDEEDDEDDDPGAISSYHLGSDPNMFFQDTGFGGDQLYRSDWPDQYIEDYPLTQKFWHEAPGFSSEPGSIGPPGLLLSQRDGKGGRKGHHQDPNGHQHGAQRPPFGGYDAHPPFGGFENFGPMGGPGTEQGFMPGAGMDFSYANGFGKGGQERGGLGFDAGLRLEGPPLASQPSRSMDAGHQGAFQFGHGGLEHPGAAPRPAQHPGLDLSGVAVGGRRGQGDPFREVAGQHTLGSLGGFGQDIWNMDASSRWVPPSGQQERSGAAVAGGQNFRNSGMPPPPRQPPPPPQNAHPFGPLGAREGDKFGGEALNLAQNGQGGNRKQRRGHLLQQWPSGEESSAFQMSGSTGVSHSGSSPHAAVGLPPGHFSNGVFGGPGTSPGHAPTGGGLGIAAGAAAVGPVVSASHERGGKGAMAGVIGPGHGGGHGGGQGGGRGQDPLAVGSTAIGSAAAVLPSSFGQGAFPSVSGMPAGPPGTSFGESGGTAPLRSKGEFNNKSSQSRMFNAGGKGGHGPWVPEGIDISSAFAMATSGQGQSGERDRGGRGRREKAKGAVTNNIPGHPANAQSSRMPLNGGGPKRTDYLRKYGTQDDEGNAAVPITTMMLKNIPCRKSQEEVMEHIDSKGFSGRYDFFYLPRDVKFRANLGYAFINFVTPEDAAAFQAELDGYQFANSGSTKACAVVAGHVQGLMNNLAAFKRTEVMRSSRKPYFSGGVAL